MGGTLYFLPFVLEKVNDGKGDRHIYTADCGEGGYFARQDGGRMHRDAGRHAEHQRWAKAGVRSAPGELRGKFNCFLTMDFVNLLKLPGSYCKKKREGARGVISP
jgi:hypothetical protein